MAQNCVSGILCKSIRAVGSEGAGAQILADMLTLFQSGGRLCPPHYHPSPPGFSDVPTALSTHAVPWKPQISHKCFQPHKKMTINSESNKLKYILLETFIIQNENCTFFATHIYDVS